MPGSHVLVISHEIVDARMAGPGIRYSELARVLAQRFHLTLAVPGKSDGNSSQDRLAPWSQPGSRPSTASSAGRNFELWPYQRGRWETLEPVAAQASVLIACGDTLAEFPGVADLGVPLVVDGYDPHSLETLALWAGAPLPVQAARHRERLAILRRQCQAGDFFICASERQRDWWLGLLEQHGRVNPLTYADDPSLRRLVDVVPYGLPAQAPEAGHQVLRGRWPGIDADDHLILWGGGLWEWLDPLTAVRAVYRLVSDGQHVRLVFPGTRHPNPGVPDMPMREQTIALAGEMGLADQYVFFGDWVPYEDWPAVLLEADVGLSLHPDTVEARLAYRSRVLDYIWAGLPMVLTRGDAMSAVAEQYGLGVIVDFKDDSAVADAILTVLERPRSAWQEGFSQVQAEMTWERAAEPLIDFCLQPTPAADRIAKIRHAKHDAAKGSDEVILDLDVLRDRVRALDWYHTIDLGHGIVTPGIFDHRPYLPLYGIPEDLTGKTALDVGAASGFFSFEMERRGAAVTAIDLPAWEDHDFGPNYEPDMTRDQATRYLREPILLAREALGSQIEKLEMSVHDLSPETVGTHDLVFCGSMLLHLTDPIQALWRLKSVTRDMAIIATVIHPTSSGEPLALFVGHERGDGWWFPNSACFEAWLQSAGFAGWEWFSEFRLDYRDGQEGPYHGVVRAWTSLAGRRILQAEPSSRIAAGTGRPAASLQQRPSELDEEVARLRALVDAYERGRFMQWMRRIHGWRKKVGL